MRHSDDQLMVEGTWKEGEGVQSSGVGTRFGSPGGQ